MAKTDRIKLHIGAHRTGTTSLQAALHSQRPSLSARGIGYWGPHAMRANRFPGVFLSLGVGPLSADQQMAVESIVEINTALLEAQLEYQRHEGHEQIILSEENILGSIKMNFKSSGLYPDAPNRLALFARIFGPYISRISLTIRSYDAYWRSLIAFWLFEGGALPTPRKLQSLADQPLRWLDVVRDVSIAFPNAEIRVMPFENWIPDHQAHIDAIFGAPLGLPQQKTLHMNASKDKAFLHQKLRARGEIDAAERLGAAAAPYQPFSPAHIAQMQAAYAADLAQLQQGGMARVKLVIPAESS